MSVVAKVLEQIVKQQSQHFLETYNILSVKQFGFRASINTSDVLFSIEKLIMDTTIVMKNIDGFHCLE